MYAIAHVRGGGELGPVWHERGSGLGKLNSIEDFIAAVRFLQASGYAGPGKAAAYGSSAGGLLIAAAVNRAPDLFRAVILDAPFLDIAGTMLNPELPHTLREYEEWGNPNDVQVLRYIQTYSPYDNLRPQPYPAMLILHNIHDQIIPPERTLCWVKHLRRLKTDENPAILLLGETGTHSRPSDVSIEMEQEALKYAFALENVR